MKKIISLSAVLLTAVLLFSGCSNAAGGDGSGDSLPGKWVSASSLADNEYYNDFDNDSWKASKNITSFKCARTKLEIQDGYSRQLWLDSFPKPLYGVHVKIKQKYFTGAECGLLLFYSDEDGNTSTTDDTAYYELSFWKGSYTMREKVKGKEVTQLSGDNQYKNTWNDAINEEGKENDVLLYSDGDNLVLKVNGTVITTFKRKLNSGTCKSYMYIPSSATGIMDVNWEYVEYQTAK